MRLSRTRMLALPGALLGALVLSAGAARVEGRYRDGGAASAATAGPGFLVLADPAREPVSAVALDSRGRVLGSAPLTGLRFRFCRKAAGC
jgi:hypothetical protein